MKIYIQEYMPYIVHTVHKRSVCIKIRKKGQFSILMIFVFVFSYNYNTSTIILKEKRIQNKTRQEFIK